MCLECDVMSNLVNRVSIFSSLMASRMSISSSPDLPHSLHEVQKSMESAIGNLQIVKRSLQDLEGPHSDT